MLFNVKAISVEKQQWHFLTHSWESKEVHTFPKGISPKVNVLARLEFELAHFEATINTLVITPR